MILYLKDQENSTKECLDIIGIFSEVAGCKINLQKSVAFLQTEKQYRKTIPFILVSKHKKKPRNKLKGSERPLQ
jgi:hypothetical protein